MSLCDLNAHGGSPISRDRRKINLSIYLGPKVALSNYAIRSYGRTITWEQVLDYAHRLGPKFTWVQTANHVHQETWWRHPELRPGDETGWFGCSLCYSKGRDLVRQTRRHTFERFKNADYFMLMFSDGGGACYCDECSRDQAAVFLRMVADVCLSTTADPVDDMLRYVRDKGLAGVDGYRLAPHGRVLNDFVFMRLAWNPDLTPDQLIDEMAGYLTSRPENRAKVVEGIKALDAYWENQDQLANIDRAAKLFDEAKVSEPSYQLEYTADMLSLLPGIHRLNHGHLPPEEAEQVRQRLFAETQRRYILQGFGSTDYQWVPEGHGDFRQFLNLCVPVPIFTPPLPQPASSSEQVDQ